MRIRQNQIYAIDLSTTKVRREFRALVLVTQLREERRAGFRFEHRR